MTHEETLVHGLIERQRIEKVLFRYCEANDRADETLLRSVFHPDAVDDHVGIVSGPIAEVLPKLVAMRRLYSVTQHVLSNIDIDIRGTVAISHCLVAAHHCYEADGRTCHLVAHGRYDDRLELRENEWRIAHRTARTDFVLKQRLDPSVPGPVWAG